MCIRIGGSSGLAKIDAWNTRMVSWRVCGVRNGISSLIDMATRVAEIGVVQK